MEKRLHKNLFVFLITIIIFIILFSVIASVFSSALEYNQVRKPYSWIKSKCIKNWQNLRADALASCLIALKDELTARQLNDSVTKLLAKSNNGECWPSGNCNVIDSSLAKIALYEAGYTEKMENVTNWTLEREKPVTIKDMDWYLQIIQNPNSKILCSLDYANNNYEFSINDSGYVLGSNPGSCFAIDKYWLKLNPTDACLKENYNLTCNDSIKTNFMFKKTNQQVWYVFGNLKIAEPTETITLNISSYCINGASGCDYESTLWAAFAFSYVGDEENAKKLSPYLIAEEKNYPNLMPKAFLYYLTGIGDYANETGKLQSTDGFIQVPGSTKCKYYNTALALWTESLQNAESFNMTKLETKLLSVNEQKKEGSYFYWGCSSSLDDSIKETSLLLVGLGINKQTADECSSNGYSCVDNCTGVGGTSQQYACSSGECCDVDPNAYGCEEKYGTCKSSCFSNNETKQGYNCETGICCKLNSQSLCTSELDGKICSQNQECTNTLGTIIPFIVSSDSPRCCQGACTTKQQTCVELGGVICDPNSGSSCQGANTLPSSELYCCRIGFCVQGQLTCSQKAGVRCQSGEECKDGTMVDASDTNGMTTCCTTGGRCLQSTCSDSICNEGESCDGSNYETMDTLVCCDGSCTVELQSCLDLGGQECINNMVCSQSTIPSEDNAKCCLGTCKEKGKFPWAVVIIILIIIIIAGVIYWLVKSGKIKLKGKGKEEDDFGFPSDAAGGMASFGAGAISPSKPSLKPVVRPMPMPTKQAPQAPAKTMQAKPLPTQKAPEKKPVKKKPASELDENLAELEKLGGE